MHHWIDQKLRVHIYESGGRTGDEMHAAYVAAGALGMMQDHRATDHLAQLFRDAHGAMEDAVEKALGTPHHRRALPALAEIARASCAGEAGVHKAKGTLTLMRQIDPLESQPYIEALAPLVLEAALRELPRVSAWHTTPGETILAWCAQSAGREALEALLDALVQHHRQIVTKSTGLDEISSSLKWLQASTRSAAAAAVTEFMRTPARQVTKRISIVISDADDRFAAQTATRDIACDTSELGQPCSLEELAERDATGPAATERTRQAYQAMKAERERCERVYPDLINLGDQRDLENYAQACLKDAVYDVSFTTPADSHEPSKPKLNYLAFFLQRALDNAKAAELLRLILSGDRTRLWESARQALVLRQTIPGWPAAINWKPLALELLEQTCDPALDEFLISQIETGGEAGEPSLMWKTVERRNPEQLLELAVRVLVRAPVETIPRNDQDWTTASTRNLLSRSLLGTYCDLALDTVLGSKPAALRIARERHSRERKQDHMIACLMMCLLPGLEIETELTSWLAHEAHSGVSTYPHVSERVRVRLAERGGSQVAPAT